jgi:hypothetical protein
VCLRLNKICLSSSAFSGFTFCVAFLFEKFLILLDFSVLMTWWRFLF